MLLSLVGSFKIESHSNVNHRRIYTDRKDQIRDRRSMNAPVPRTDATWQIPVNRFKFIKLFSYCILAIGLYFLINFSDKVHTTHFHSTKHYMQQTALRLTGKIRVTSQGNTNIINAKQLIRKGQFLDAHSLLIDNYKLGNTDVELYELLRTISTQLCENGNSYCDEANDWGDVLIRLKAP